MANGEKAIDLHRETLSEQPGFEPWSLFKMVTADRITCTEMH
jgi:hypothetical protein